MNSMDYLRIAPFINDCPNCGSDMIDNSQGTLEVSGNLIKRTCECGFRFEYDANSGTTKAKIQKSVKEALTNM